MYDGSIRIKTKIDNSDVSPAMGKLKQDLQVAKQEADFLYEKFAKLSDELKSMPRWKIKSDDYKKLAENVAKSEIAFEKAGNRVNDYQRRINKLSQEENKFEFNKDMGTGFKKGIKSVIKFGAALFTLRTIFTGITRASGEYLATHEETATRMKNIWTYLGAIIGPLIEWISRGIMKLIGYINVFLKALTGIDFAQKANENIKAINNQEKAQKKLNKTTASFDEMNVLSDNSNSESSSGSSTPIDIPELDSNITKTLEDIGSWLRDNKELALGLGIAIGGALAIEKLVGFKNVLKTIGSLFVKTGADGTKSFNKVGTGITIALAGAVLLIKSTRDLITGWDEMDTKTKILKTSLVVLGGVAVAFGLKMATGMSLATGGLIALIGVIGTIVIAFATEKDAILSVEDAQKQLLEAEQKYIEANESYVSAVDRSEEAFAKLEEAERKTGLSGEYLFKQVEDGILDYANMTEAQREVYKAYLENDSAQRTLDASTKELTNAKKAEIQAYWDNELALAEQEKDYESYKNKVVEAFQNGEISAEQAREAIEKSMSRMSDSSQKTFMEDIPEYIKEGMNPDRYQTTGQKLKNWFGTTWENIKTKTSEVWDEILGLFSKSGQIFKGVTEAIADTFKKLVNLLIDGINIVIATPFNLINGMLNKIRGISFLGISPFKGLWKENPLPVPQFPKLAKGGVVYQPTQAIIGEAGPERIIPLSEDAEWIDNIASKINGNSNSQPINIYLPNGKLLAQYILDVMQQRDFVRNGSVL